MLESCGQRRGDVVMEIVDKLNPLRPEPSRLQGPRAAERSRPHARPTIQRMTVTQDNVEGITAAQRRALFGWAQRRGLSHEDLRALTPAGSVSRLSREQAAELIELLTGRPGTGDPIEPRGTVTRAQIGLLAHLRDRLGFTAAGFESWLRRHFGVRALEDLNDRGEASRIIAALLNMKATRDARAEGRPGVEIRSRAGRRPDAV